MSTPMFGSLEFAPFRTDDRLAAFIGSIGIHRDDSSLTLRVVAHDQAVNRVGTLHGGALATLFDVAMYDMARLDGEVVTLAQEVKFLRAIAVAEPLFIRTEMLKPGRTIVFCDARAWQLDRTCGYATAQFARV